MRTDRLLHYWRKVLIDDEWVTCIMTSGSGGGGAFGKHDYAPFGRSGTRMCEVQRVHRQRARHTYIGDRSLSQRSCNRRHTFDDPSGLWQDSTRISDHTVLCLFNFVTLSNAETSSFKGESTKGAIVHGGRAANQPSGSLPCMFADASFVPIPL